MRYWTGWTGIKMGLLAGVVAWGLSACGFHLKGMGQQGALPFSQVYLQNTASAGDLSGDLYYAMQRQLHQNGIQLASADLAQVRIDLSDVVVNRSTTSLSATGQVAAELVKLSTQFQAYLPTSSTGRPFVEGKVAVYRDRQVNEQAALASARALAQVQKQLTKQLAQQILTRVVRAYPQTASLDKAQP